MERKNLRDNFYKLLLNSLGNRDKKQDFLTKLNGKNLSADECEFLVSAFNYANSMVEDFEINGEIDQASMNGIKSDSKLSKEDKKYIQLLYKNASKMVSRRFARDYAYQLIFSHLFDIDSDEMLREQIMSDKKLSDSDIEYINLTYNNIAEHKAEIEELIAKYAIGYTLDRIYKPDLAVLLYAISEMKYNDNVPDRVAINEAVALVKKYSTSKSGQFVNGILGGVFKELNWYEFD